MRTVLPMTASQELSRLVREVERGEGFLIARQGRRSRVDGGPPTHDGAAGAGGLSGRVQDRAGRPP